MERKIGEIFEDRGCWYQCIRDMDLIIKDVWQIST